MIILNFHIEGEGERYFVLTQSIFPTFFLIKKLQKIKAVCASLVGATLQRLEIRRTHFATLRSNSPDFFTPFSLHRRLTAQGRL